MSKTEGEISWKKKLFFKEEYNANLHLTIVEGITRNKRFVIVTDDQTLLAIDIKTDNKVADNAIYVIICTFEK